MATAISNYLAAKVLNSTFRNINWSLETSWFALHTSDPTSTGNPTTEVVGGSYLRKQGSAQYWTTPSTLSIAYNQAVVWSNMPAVTLTHISLWTGSSGGNMLFWGALSAPVVIPGGGAYTLAANDFAITLSA